MNTKFAALTAAMLLTAGCGTISGPVDPLSLPEGTAPAASSTSVGSSSSGTQQSSPARPAGRTREEVRAEAVEAVKNYKPTQQQERDWFNPYAQ